jgi:hypothetical protein
MRMNRAVGDTSVRGAVLSRVGAARFRGNGQGTRTRLHRAQRTGCSAKRHRQGNQQHDPLIGSEQAIKGGRHQLLRSVPIR